MLHTRNVTKPNNTMTTRSNIQISRKINARLICYKNAFGGAPFAWLIRLANGEWLAMNKRCVRAVLKMEVAQ